MAEDTTPESVEPIFFDFDTYARIQEERKQGMAILVPGSPEEMETRRKLISKVGGKAPDLYMTFQARVWNAMALSIIKNEEVDWDKISMERDILELMMSHKGWRADAVKEMHQMAAKPPPHRGLIDAFLGRK